MATPTTDDSARLQADIADDRLRKHEQAGIGIVVGTALVAAVVTAQFWTGTAWNALLGGWLALGLVFAARLTLPRWHARWTQRRSAIAYRVVFGVHGLLWLCAAAGLAPGADEHAVELLLVALALLAGSALVLTAFDIVTGWCFALPALLGVPLAMGRATAPFNPLLPVLLLTFVAPLSIAARRAGLRTMRAVMHRLDESRSRHAERRQSELMDRVGRLALVGGWEYNVVQRQLSWTPQALRLLGLEDQDRPSVEAALSLVQEPSLSRWREAVKRAGRDGHGFELDLVLRRADGIRVTVRAQCQAVREAGRLVRLTGAIQDVTAARSAEQDLRAYQTALNAMQDMASMVRDDNIYMMVNDAWCRRTGLTRQQVIGHDMREVMPGSVSAGRRAAFLACVEQGQLKHYCSSESGLPMLDGRFLETTYYPHQPEPDGPRYAIIVSRDVTEAEQARTALATSTEYLRRTLNATADAIFASDATSMDEPVRFVNDRMLRMWNMAPEQAVGLSPQVILDHAAPLFIDAPAELKRIRQIIEGNLDAEDRLPLRDGRVLLRRCAAAGSGAGMVRVWTFRDITAEEQSRAALVTAKNEAEAANRAKSQFLSQMSHELRTPLNAILGFAQLLELDADGKHAVDRQASVREILRGGRHLLSLISDLLDLARIESGRLEVDLAPVVLRPMLEDCLSLMRPLAESKGVALLDVAGDALDGVLHADAIRLKQVLLNLLGNAIKYNHDGGWVQVHAERDGGWVRLCVDDDGPGLNEEQRQRLFQPFERLHAARSGTEGTGIGLALSRLLVQAMGGDIGVDSRPGEGSRFWIRLPRHVSNGDTRRPAAGAAPALSNSRSNGDAP